MLENRRVDPRDPDTVEWGDQVSEVKPCVEFTELPGRFGIRTSQFFNNADVDVFLDISSTELTRITSTDPEEMPAAGEFYADGGSGYIFVHSSHLGADIRADYYPGGAILTAEVLDSAEFQGPQGEQGDPGPTGPAGGVDSVFGRTGVIVAATSDYTQDQVTDGTTNKQFSATEKTKLSGIATGADVTASALLGAINGYSAASALAGTEKIPIVQSGATVAATPDQLKTYIGPAFWVHFNGTGTPAIVASSANVSSITDNGVGDYTINFSPALENLNFAIQASGSGDFVGTGWGVVTLHRNSGSGTEQAPTTSAIRINTYAIGTGQADLKYIYVAGIR